MNRKAIGILVLILILMSTLNLASLTRTVLAQKGKNNATDTDLLKETSQKDLVNNPASPQRLNGLDKDGSEVLRGEQKAKQESSESTADKWNFNSTSEWSSFAYLNGTNTRLIVGLDGEEPASFLEIGKTAIRHQARIVDTISIKGKVRAAVVELSLASVASFVGDVRSMGLASYVEPNMKVQVQLVPNDPYWSLQWGPQKIEANSAWDTTVGNSSILVAVVDTGIDYNHPDLATNYMPIGYDWANMDPDPLDDFGHGTHCAGIIAAVLNNGLGIAGIAQVRIMAEKVLDEWGSGYWDWIANGIIDAVNRGAKIISMSLGGYGDSELLHDAVRYAYDSGVLVVAAAGNDNTNMKLYPAAYDEVIAVAATDQYDEKASFSNWGDWIELAAPGVSIYSTMPTYEVTLNWYFGYSMNYDFLSGTSMACPHVAGVAALVWGMYPEKTRDWVRLWLRYTADDLGDPGFDMYYGYGRVNARKAVEQAPPTHELIAYNWKTPLYVKPGASGVINVTVLNFGESSETDVAIQLLANGTIVANEAIGFLAGGSSTLVSLTWNPSIEAMYNVTLYVVPVPGETSVENNVLWKYIYVGFPVKAVVLHSAGNVFGEIITNWQTLNNEWRLFGGTMVYVDYETLSKDDITYADIAATAADVLIISCAYDPYAGWQFTDSEIEAITEYVHEGHGLIATAGTFYYEVPNNNKLAPLFGLDETIMYGSTVTDLLHLVNVTHPIFAGVPNPLVFPQVGTALPSDRQWDSNELRDGKYIALGHYRESSVVTYRGLVYISPWLEVTPPYYHHHLQLLYNAILWSRYQKPQHELVVSVQVPNRLDPGEVTRLNATVSNNGLNNETGVELQLFINGLPVEAMAIPQLLVGSSCTLSYLWTATVQGAYNVTAYAPPILGEEFTENNVAKASVLVLVLAVRNALVYADDYAMPPSSRYVIVALDNLGINYTYYADDPSGFGEALVSQPWDLVVVDHCNYYDVGNHWNELEEYVQNGGLLVLSTFDVDGSDSQPTTLWDTLGIRWVSDMGSPEPVYRWNPSHPLFTFPNSIGDLTSYTEGYWDDGDHLAATTGTAVAGFATSPREDYAGIVVSNAYPTVLFSFILDEFRSDENHDGKLEAIELWENAIAYLAKGCEHDLAVSLDAPKFPQLGDSAVLNATVRNRGSSNETVELQLWINCTIVDSIVIPEFSSGSSYTISYLWTPDIGGAYNLTGYAPPVLGENRTENNRVSKFVDVLHWVSTFVTEDNWPIPPDNDLDYFMYNTDPKHPTEWAHWYDLSPCVMRAMLQIYAYDVDWPDEVDEVYFNGQYLGRLKGADNQWILNEFTVPASYVQCGFNVVEVYVDRAYVGWYGMEVDWGNLTIGYLPPEHELRVSLDAPAYLEPDHSALLNATVENLGLNNETNVELHLLINGTTVGSATIPQLLVRGSYVLTYLWAPKAEAAYNVTAFAPPVLGEEITANNQESRFVGVFEMVIGVVLDSYGTDYASNTFWDYLNTDWATYGTKRIVIDYTSLNKENITLADIEATHADVLIISDAWSDTYEFGWEFSDSEIEAIRTYVSGGHGIIATSGTFDTWSAPNNQKLAELFGMDPAIQYNWGFDGDQKVTSGTFELQSPRHNELWRNMPDPYLSGSLVTLNPTPSSDWMIQGVTTGRIEALSTDHYAAVITSEAITHKAVYFTCILEGDGQYNENNRQLFYNAVIWLSSILVSPVANFTWAPPMPRATKTVTFNASSSTPDPDTTVSYTWGFGDGNTTTTTNPIITHRYASPKRYNVTLTVLNSAGLTGSITKSVKITSLADINMDGVVDIKDFARVTAAFGSYPGHPKWDSACDINGDNRIDIRDVAYVTKYFGWRDS